MRKARWCLVAVMSTMITVPALPGQAAGPRVTTEGGVVAGKREGAVSAFLGIPYAAPPVGELRWKPPVATAKWNGVRDATEFGARCMQGRVFDDMVFRDPGPTEDCLTLNVWVPGNAKAKLPVMVWIYGGGFVAGGTSEPRQDGTNLAKQGVVVVSMNYRLGVFGFFTHAELAAESGRKAAGNYGLLDQGAALQWVQRNIAAFGGDPGNVTIFGESAGSFSVSALMASPLAKGLFHKAIGESGAAFYSHGLPFKMLGEREQEDVQFAAALGVKTLAALRAVPAEKLLQVAMKKEGGKTVFQFSPSVDGYFLPAPVPVIFAERKQNDVPLLGGWNHDEGDSDLNGRKEPDTAMYKAAAEKEFGARAAEFLKLYPAGTDAEARRSLQDFNGDDFIAWSTWKWLESQKRSGKQPVYRYRFDLSLPAGNQPEGLGAYHSAEIEYVFGQLGSKDLPWRAEDRALSEQMQKYWINFAGKGDPNGSGLPKWPPYVAADGWQVMHLDSPSGARTDDLRARYEFLDRVWGK
ncbi:MAG: carboxylesterase/lipase family protein [Terriglobales bacterium]